MTVENLEIKVSAKGVTAAANRFNSLADAMERVEAVSGKVNGGSTNSTAKAVQNVGKAAERAQKPLSNFLASLKRIAFYRFIRSIIKSITQAFSEGLQWAYAFSSGITTEGGRFAAAMDRMKSASSQMKAQLGSAFIGLLAALEPIIIRLVNLVIMAANAIAQFFAAFTGTTYLKSLAVADKFADTMKKGGGAAKEWKNQLLGFDEINRLNEPSGGGGGGGSSALDPNSMFEDTPLDKWAMKLRDIITWAKEHLDLIKTILGGIGAAIAAWKLTGFLSNLLGIETSLKTMIGIAMAVGGAFIFIKGACDAWANGIDWENLALMIGGIAIAATGLYIAFGSVGAAVALLAGGVSLLVIGFNEWVQTGKASNEVLTAMSVGFVAIGAAVAILTSSWIPLVVGAIGAAVVWIIGKWDEIMDAIDNLIVKIFEFQSDLASTLGNGKIEWQDFAAVAIQCIMAPIDAIIAVISWIKTLVGWIQTALTGLGLLGGTRTMPEVDATGAYTGGVKYGGAGRRASGGFVDEGELFIAREAGPELVGTMGGHTAVANNDQIIEGIRVGVYDAVSAAMNGGNRDVQVKVYLDSREIKAGQQRLNRAWGV